MAGFDPEEPFAIGKAMTAVQRKKPVCTPAIAAVVGPITGTL
jgi:hypothetical protein